MTLARVATVTQHSATVLAMAAQAGALASVKMLLASNASVLLDQVCVHECRVVGEGGRFWPAPTFQIVALDRPDEAFDGKSPTGCWNAVLRRINGEILRRIEDGENLARPPKTAIAGPEYFGFNNLDTIVAIEAQDPEHRCRAYWVGKEDREAYGDAVMEMVRSGLPPILPPEERPAPAPKPKKR